MSPKTIILMGRAGSGKGTQGALLREELLAQDTRLVFYLETGAKFRAFVSGPSYSSERGRQTIDKGELMPSFLAVWNWSSSLLDNMTGEEHLITDGLPRMLPEAVMFKEALKFYERGEAVLLHLNVPAEEVSKRLLLRGRHDDTEEGIKNRLQAFEEEVKPVLDFFKNEPSIKFIEINGHQPIEAVKAEILASLATYLHD